MPRGGKREGAGRPPSCEPRQRLVCLLPPFLLAWVDRYAKEHDIPRTRVVELALLKYLDDVEAKNSK